MKYVKPITSVVLAVLLGFTVVCFTYKSVNAEKIDSEITKAFDEGAETVAVYIWLSDIDQDSVDAEVKEKTGLTKWNLESGSRDTEMKKVDTYISERRSIAREKLVAKNTAFVREVGIEEEAIIFQSAYAPMLIAELTEKQVKKLSKRSDVISMGLYHEARVVAE